MYLLGMPFHNFPSFSYDCPSDSIELHDPKGCLHCLGPPLKLHKEIKIVGNVEFPQGPKKMSSGYGSNLPHLPYESSKGLLRAMDMLWLIFYLR